jgi:hypothetical protein
VGRWRLLPGDLPAEAVRLVRELRQYVDRSELNTAALAARTGYSRSSWLHYLNGRRLPPWQAVAGLGRLVYADPGYLRVLWESAAHAWPRTRRPPAASGTPGPARVPDTGAPSAADAPPAPSDVAGRSHVADDSTPSAPSFMGRMPGRSGALTAVAAVCALLAAVLLARPWDSGPDTGRPPDGAPPGAPAWPWPLHDAPDKVAAACRAGGCRGLDPYREKCDNDAVAVHRLRAYGHVLTLQYSPACRASWAQIDTPEATAGLRISTTGGDEQPAVAGGAYTAMVGSGPGAARATVVVRGRQLGVAQYDSWVDDITGSG